MWGSPAFIYLLLSNFAYVFGVGIALSQQEKNEWFTRRYGVDGGFKRFKRFSSLLMLNEGAAFILLCIVTANTMNLPGPRSAQIAFGLVIGVIGIATKWWATATLGPHSFHWHNFFVPTEPVPLDPPGPYRYLKNPMYTVGYLQTYGLAIVCASLPGLVASAIMQVSVLVFCRVVEQPHFEALLRNAEMRRGKAGQVVVDVNAETPARPPTGPFAPAPAPYAPPRAGRTPQARGR